VRYSYHIYGDIVHKIIDCPKYNDMQNMLLVSNPLVHMVDVNMAIIRNKFIKT